VLDDRRRRMEHNRPRDQQGQREQEGEQSWRTPRERESNKG
jgi:hypothetical protein